MENSIIHFKFALFKFSQRALNEIRLPVYKGSALRGEFGNPFETPLPSDTSKMGKDHLSPLTLHLVFLTPPQLKFDGRLSSRLEFHVLLRNLLRRISLISYFHGGYELGLDFKKTSFI